MASRQRRRVRRRLSKPREHHKALWYVARGYPVSFIAEKLHLSRNTVKAWCATYGDRRQLKAIKTRIAHLPAAARDALVRDLLAQHYDAALPGGAA